MASTGNPIPNPREDFTAPPVQRAQIEGGSSMSGQGPSAP